MHPAVTPKAAYSSSNTQHNTTQHNTNSEELQGTTTNQRSFRATTVHPAAPFVSEIRQCY